ncbi:hypothetical protein Zmor_017532 [Zophobas morio]|uniref:Uncharacterized protein n=1 Tax=Zophobas morio TaxID=2755281 RepID=A0AA38I8Y4_9CUCU|nr:hypothetical protein Zmor_017532 [Zophobas morio]
MFPVFQGGGGPGSHPYGWRGVKQVPARGTNNYLLQKLFILEHGILNVAVLADLMISSGDHEKSSSLSDSIVRVNSLAQNREKTSAVHLNKN